MALIKYGPLAQEVSGTVGGVTFARVHDAKACRGWRAPANKRRPAQLLLRQIMAVHSGRWFTSLTQTHRQAWIDYAPTCVFTNPLGQNYTISGFNMFVRNATIYNYWGLEFLVIPPSAPGFPPTYTLSFSLNHTTGVLSVAGCAPTPPAADMALFTVFDIVRASRSFPSGVSLTHLRVTSLNAPPKTIYTYPAPLPGSAGQYKALIEWRWTVANDYRISKAQRQLVTST